MSEQKQNAERDAVIDKIRAARTVSTPILAVTTADQWAFTERVRELPGLLSASAPKIVWDHVRGPRPLNDAGALAIDGLRGGTPARMDPEALRRRIEEIAADHTDPVAMLSAAMRLPGFDQKDKNKTGGTILVMHNVNLFLNSVAVIQAISNLRDAFKTNRRTLLLLDSTFKLPGCLQGDVVTLEDAPPTDEQIERILTSLYKSADLAVPTDEQFVRRAVDAGRLPSAFAAEQVFAMSLRESGVSLDAAWDLKRAAVNATAGLSMSTPTVKVEDIGGLESVVGFIGRYQHGPNPARLFLHADEIEKMMAGSGAATGQGDSTGVSQDILGEFLRNMEDNGWDGLIAVGIPGSGKSLVAKAVGATHQVPSVTLDFGGMKGSLVGESEKAVREAMRTVKCLGGTRVFVIATCNRLDSLPPELRRRFRSGIWFFDLPTAAERDAIWKLNLTKYGLDPQQQRPDDGDWTGAEIRNCCELSYNLACSLVEASAYIVPVAQADPDSVARLRSLADGRFLSASAPGKYRRPTDVQDVQEGPTRAVVVTATEVELPAKKTAGKES